jgi:hypothetical protein
VRSSRFAAFAWASVLLASAGTAGAQQAPPGKDPGRAAPAAPRPTFEVDGAPFEPRVLSLHGDPANPRPGDVVFVDGIPLTLGEGPAYRFRTTDAEEDGRVYLLLPGGRERVVGARTRWTIGRGRGNPFVVRNLLEPLTDEEMGGLWGLHLDGWNEAVAAKVARIDPARTCVAVTDSCGGPGRETVRPMPVLPAGLRALLLDENSSEGMTSLAPLADQDALVLFSTSGFSRVPLDLGLLAKSAAGIRHLRLGRAPLRSPELLAGFTFLRELDLRGNQGIADLGFVRGMAELRRLHVDGTPIRDLGPVGGLARLEEITADGTKAEVLPAGPLPALRLLRVMSAAVPAPAVAGFRKAHPLCRVWHGWNEALRAELGTGDRVVVRSGGLCHRDPDAEKVLADHRGVAKVAEFLAALEVAEEASGFHCMCCGNPTIEIYRGEVLVASLGFHHGKSLRWPGGWPGDGKLTAKSGDRLIEWLAANGAPGPKEEREKEGEEERKEAKEMAAFLAPFPEGVREFFRTESLGKQPWDRDEGKQAAFAKALAERCGGPEALAACLCRALGESSLGWSVSAWKEMRAQAALRAVTGEAFAAALPRLGDDPKALRGAARIAFQEGMLEKMTPADRGAWTARLGTAALADGEPWYAWKVARALGDADSRESRDLLWRFVDGPPPAEEKPEPPSLAAAALVSLARLGDGKAGAKVREHLGKAAAPLEKQACEVALTLLGEKGLLRPHHFTGRSWTIVSGAMDAVERSPRREGIEALVAGMQLEDVHFGFEVADGFFRATGWSCPTEGRPYPWVHRQCLAWWGKNRDGFLAKVRGTK